MPKIINNLEEKIYKAAFKLFSLEGYDHVCMKAIAEEAGIAVGTLYNYYAHKDELFFKILKKNLKQTFSILNEIIEDDGSTLEFMTALYDETVRIKQFIEEVAGDRNKCALISDEEKYLDDIRKLREDLLTIMRELIEKIADRKNLTIPEKYKKRIIRILLMSVINLSAEFPGEREDNIYFITNLVFY